MSDLEELGYLEQPHTSAGRIPSAKGYRLYVDSMLSQQPVPLQDAEKIEMLWKHSNGSTSELFLNMAKLLSQVSHSMSLFLAPAHDRALIKYIHVLPLDSHQAIMVVITETGALDNEPVSYTHLNLVQHIWLLAIMHRLIIMKKLVYMNYIKALILPKIKAMLCTI